MGKSFDEVIKRDKNFGKLLTKIKKAYDEYLTKLASQSQRTMSDPKQVEAAQQEKNDESALNLTITQLRAEIK